MPVLSPRQSSASALTGAYRSSFSSSSDRPYFTSSSYSPRITSYSERYTTRTYSDSDGRRIFSRSGSITEDGLTTRYREESRDTYPRRDSLSRDSGISSIRENSVSDFASRRDSSVTRENSLSRLNVLDSVAELRNKYSPANYVPACQRERNENISRSKSINDIGLPPVDVKIGKKKSPNYNNTTGSVTHLNSNIPTNDNMKLDPDDANNNPPPRVADLRKKFDEKPSRTIRPPQLEIEGVSAFKIAENTFKKQDSKAKKIKTNESSGSKGTTRENCQSNSDLTSISSKLEVDEQIIKNGEDLDVKRGSRVNHYASYISTRELLQKGDSGTNGEIVGGSEEGEQVEENKEDFIVKRFNSDISTSPKLSTTSTRSAISPSASTFTSNTSTSSPSRRSSDRLFNDDIINNKYELNDKHATSPVKTQGLNGLKNIGNTCFMNSVIQCLSNTKQLLEYFLQDSYLSDVNVSTSSMKGALIKAFVEVIKKLWSQDGGEKVVNTSNLKSQIQRFAPRFIGYAQQDAQEFLRYLLEGLHEDVNRVKEKPKPILTEMDEKLSDSEKSSESWARYLRMDNSKIVDYFVGQLKSTLKCTHCGHCSVTFDPFWDLSLPIPQRAGQVRLAQCLDSFTREETLDGDEKPTCSKCKERRKCTKSFTIQKFPKILVIHLKRFSLAERFRGKLSVTVDFPLEGLDMSHYAADNVAPCRYNLYAISNHSGTTYSGHYTAYCRHPYTKQWHEYNDSRVSSISSKSIVSGEAYVLFYEQEGQKSHL